MSKHQTHCRTCLRVFEADSPEEVVRKVEEHEGENSCVRPVYDAAKGRFLKDEELAELRAVKA